MWYLHVQFCNILPSQQHTCSFKISFHQLPCHIKHFVARNTDNKLHRPLKCSYKNNQSGIQKESTWYLKNINAPTGGGCKRYTLVTRDEEFFVIFAFKICLSHLSVMPFLSSALPPKEIPVSATATETKNWSKIHRFFLWLYNKAVA